MVQRLRQAAEVQPQIERRRRRVPHPEPDLAQPLYDVVPLLVEDPLQDLPLRVDELGIEERDGGDLERVGGAAVEEGAALAEGVDERLRTDDPGGGGDSAR